MRGPMATTGQAALWRDWCAATGRNPGVVTVPALTEHLIACPAPSRRARRARIRAVLTVTSGDEQTRTALLPAPPAPDRVIRDGEQWLSVNETLAALDPNGWPAGAVARRDAWLIVLLGPLGMTRNEALALTPATVDVPQEGTGGWPVIAGIDVPFHADPALCSACVAVRWLRVLAAGVDGGRRNVEWEIAADSARGFGHRCGDGVPTGWVSAQSLAPSIDRHGWLGPTLTRRSVTAIVSARQRAYTSLAAETSESRERHTSAAMGTRPAPDPMLDDALDRLDAALDAAMSRMAGVLDAAEGSLTN